MTMDVWTCGRQPLQGAPRAAGGRCAVDLGPDRRERRHRCGRGHHLQRDPARVRGTLLPPPAHDRPAAGRRSRRLRALRRRGRRDVAHRRATAACGRRRRASRPTLQRRARHLDRGLPAA
ncbi:MAG: hypothetical protein MZV70_10845 [Desulfobacterales bacterium]|nr:hypothetical protein [Desulfobacterales bacterium]